MFNYIQFIDKFDSSKLGFDFSVFRAVGVNSVYYDQYMNNPELISNVSHWIYGTCNDNTDIKGIEDIINPVVYNNAACIREYYNANERKYYKTGEKGFIWPIIEKGCSNLNGTFYGIIIQRCDYAPKSLKYNGPACKSEGEISKIIGTLSLKFQIVDQYADILNYTNPFTKYFYEVASAIKDGIYIINHLNFNPADMLTHNGIFFDNQIDEYTYIFKQNEKHTIDQSSLPANQTTNGCLIGVYLWMQNTLQHFERNYDKLQDLLSYIGGISRIIMTLGYYLNLLINNYISLLDIEELIINRDKMNYEDRKKFKRRPSFLKKIKEIENPSRRQFLTEHSNLFSTNKQQMSSLNRGKENLNSPNSKYNKINIYNKNKIPYKNKYYYKNNNKILKEKNENLKITIRAVRKTSEQKYKKEEGELTIKRHNFNWFKYIWYLICCKSNNNMIGYWENIRYSLISEENIIQNYIDIYTLLKIHNIEKKNIFNNLDV